MPPRLRGHAREVLNKEVGVVESVAAPPERARHIPENDLSQVVRRALYETGYAPLFDIECFSEGDTVILQGRVPSYYLKQVAQSVAVRLCGTARSRTDLKSATRWSIFPIRDELGFDRLCVCRIPGDSHAHSKS